MTMHTNCIKKCNFIGQKSTKMTCKIYHVVGDFNGGNCIFIFNLLIHFIYRFIYTLKACGKTHGSQYNIWAHINRHIEGIWARVRSTTLVPPILYERMAMLMVLFYSECMKWAALHS